MNNKRGSVLPPKRCSRYIFFKSDLCYKARFNKELKTMVLERELSFRLNAEQHDFLRALAKANGVTVTSIIRDALNEYLNVGE